MHNETPIFSTIAHPAAHLGGYLGLAATFLISVAGFFVHVGVGLLLLAISGFGFLMLELVRRADRIALYEDGLAREYRLLSTKRTFTEYESIQDLEVTQTFPERVLGIGTIHINTAGANHQEIVFHGIKKSHELEAAIRYRMRPTKREASPGVAQAQTSVDTGATENVG